MRSHQRSLHRRRVSQTHRRRVSWEEAPQRSLNLGGSRASTGCTPPGISDSCLGTPSLPTSCGCPCPAPYLGSGTRAEGRRLLELPCLLAPCVLLSRLSLGWWWRVCGDGWRGQLGAQTLLGVARRYSEYRAGSSWSYFYGREGAWSPPWGGAPKTLISGVTEWPTQALPSCHPSSSLSRE